MTYSPTGRPPGRPRKQQTLANGQPNLTPAQWRAIRAEVLLWSKRPRWAKWPQPATGARIARLAGVSKMSVSEWRRDPTFQNAFWAAALADKAPLEVVAKKICDALDRSARIERLAQYRGRPKRRFVGLAAKTRNAREVEILKHLRGKFPAEGITSPLDEKHYPDARSYARHLAAAEAVIIAR
jgi:hypothetical protein